MGGACKIRGRGWSTIDDGSKGPVTEAVHHFSLCNPSRSIVRVGPSNVPDLARCSMLSMRVQDAPSASPFSCLLDVHEVRELRHSLVSVVQPLTRTYLQLRRPASSAVCPTVGVCQGLLLGCPAKNEPHKIVAAAVTNAAAAPRCRTRTGSAENVA